jgi:hypothetical protein
MGYDRWFHSFSPHLRKQVSNQKQCGRLRRALGIYTCGDAMTAPDKIWADWTPFDDETMPATLSCHTPKSNGTAEYTRVEYIRADLVAAPDTRVVTVAQLERIRDVLSYANHFIATERGGGGLRNPMRDNALAELRAVIGGQDNE